MILYTCIWKEGCWDFLTLSKIIRHHRYYVSVNWRTCVCQHLLVVAIDLSRYGTFSHMIIYLCFLKSHSFYYFSVNFYHWDFLKNTQLTKSLALPITFKSFFNSWYFLSSNRIPNEMLAFFRSLSLLQKNKSISLSDGFCFLSQKLH